jgi:HD-like signal output (HDOD) protein
MTETARATPASDLTLFKFVQHLAGDLANDLELPGFPDIVVRLHRVLGDEQAGSKDIVRLVTSEPALAARLIQLANSAAFNPGDKQISELRSAITLLGFNLVRSTATTFAMRQLQQQAWLETIRPQLTQLWQDSTTVAAIAFVAGRQIQGIRPDEALASGLFHQLGGLYVVTKAHKEGIAIGTNGNWAETIAAWQPAIGKAILETWGMATHLVEAVESQDALTADTPPLDLPLLTRLLAASKIYRRVMNPDGKDPAADQALLEKVNFGATPYLDIVKPGHAEIAKVREMIGR